MEAYSGDRGDTRGVKMKKSTINFFCLIVFVLSGVYELNAESHYNYIYTPKSDVYFGHISYLEVKEEGKETVVFREGKTAPEVAVLNFPIVPGDTVKTTESSRCEIQFDTGTIVRLDTNTEIKFETILAQSLSSQYKLTNMVLQKGQAYVMYKQYKAQEILQILTSNSSTKPKHGSVLILRANGDGSTDLKVNSGSAAILYGTGELETERVKVFKNEELTVTLEHDLLYSAYKDVVDFDLWNQDLNVNFEELHKGVSPLPKPIQRLSPAVFYFAQKFSNQHGDWIWNDIYGYVWRPFYNDRYPDGNWQPYASGKWREINETLFWIPQEPWGWVPYHLGVWIWDKDKGWLWLPGSAFAPAWVAWNFYMGHLTWRPWSLWDWYFWNFFGTNTSFWMPYYALYNVSEDPRGERIPPPQGIPTKKPALYKIRKNQLKKKGTAPFKPPKVMRKALNNLAKALARGDSQILDSLKAMPNPMLVVREENLYVAQIQNYSQSFSPLDEDTKIGLLVRDPQKNFTHLATRIFRRNEIVTCLAKNLVMDKTEESETVASPSFVEQTKRTIPKSRFESLVEQMKPQTRFRDWNPDIRQAQRQNVTISYSSRYNLIQCPELGLSSQNVNVRGGTSPQGGFYQASSSSSSSSAGGSSSNPTSAVEGSSSSSTSSSSAKASSSSAGSTAAKIK